MRPRNKAICIDPENPCLQKAVGELAWSYSGRNSSGGRLMRSALYYPHTEIRTEALWKSALLMWDEIHTIIPYPEYRPQYSDRRFAEAFELIGVSHVPDYEEKSKAHEIIEDFATRPLPKSFSYKFSIESQATPYELYPEKFFPQTYDLLQKAGLSGAKLSNADYPTAEPTGLSLMSILADCCAGSSLARTTDRGEAYASLSGLFVEEPWLQDSSAPTPDQLVPLALETVNLQNISLESLIDLRRREMKSGGSSDIVKLRYKFVELLEKQSKALKSATTQRDAIQMKKEFHQDLKRDMRELKEALQLRVVDTLSTKEIITTVLAATGSVAAMLAGSGQALHEAALATGGLITLGGLVSTTSKMFTSRKKLLLKHPTAYLYEVQSGLKL
jgi:hypothetical protein